MESPPLPPKASSNPRLGQSWANKDKEGQRNKGTNSSRNSPQENPHGHAGPSAPAGERECVRESKRARVCVRTRACPGIRKMKQKRPEKKTKARHLVQEWRAQKEMQKQPQKPTAHGGANPEGKHTQNKKPGRQNPEGCQSGRQKTTKTGAYSQAPGHQ